MSVQDYTTITLEILSVITIIGVGARWIMKKYVEQILSELKPNGGGSIKDQVTRLEDRVNEADQMRRDMNKKLDRMYDILIDHVAKNND